MRRLHYAWVVAAITWITLLRRWELSPLMLVLAAAAVVVSLPPPR